MPERPRPPLGSLAGVPCPVPSGNWTNCPEPQPFPVSTFHRDLSLAGRHAGLTPPFQRVSTAALSSHGNGSGKGKGGGTQSRAFSDCRENMGPFRNLEAWSPAWPELRLHESPLLKTSSRWLSPRSLITMSNLSPKLNGFCLHAGGQGSDDNSPHRLSLYEELETQPCSCQPCSAVFLLLKDDLLNQKNYLKEQRPARAVKQITKNNSIFREITSERAAVLLIRVLTSPAPSPAPQLKVRHPWSKLHMAQASQDTSFPLMTLLLVSPSIFLARWWAREL